MFSSVQGLHTQSFHLTSFLKQAPGPSLDNPALVKETCSELKNCNVVEKLGKTGRGKDLCQGLGQEVI